MTTFSLRIKVYSQNIICLSVNSKVVAQDEEMDNPGSFGFKGDVGLTTISFETDNAEVQKNRFKIGGLIGVSYEIRMGKVFALNLEVDLVNKGSKFTANLLGGNEFILKNNIFSVDIPLNLKFYSGDNFNINAWSYLSTTIAAINKSFTRTADGDKIDIQDLKNYFSNDYEDIAGVRYLNRFDVGLSAGFEFVSNGGFGVGARF